MSSACERHSRLGIMVTLVASLFPSALWGQSQTIGVDLKLRSGGSLSGLVVDHNAHGLVVVAGSTPFVFAWSELEGGSAWATRRDLVASERGGVERLSAEDHFQLGLFALAQDRNDLAADAFRGATKLRSDYEPHVREAFNAFRRRKDAPKTPVPGAADDDPLEHAFADQPEITPTPAESGENPAVALPDFEAGARRSRGPFLPRPSETVQAQVMEAYRTFGAKVQEVLGQDIVLLESDHFLIWTDWEKRGRQRLTDWCEAMYAALGAQFDLDRGCAGHRGDNIFLAKCPVFCWRSRARFHQFARQFDGHEGSNAVGYTRSIERNGHVHIVLLRQGRTEADVDRFACTLVHEGTHAFLHRLYSPRLIPPWVNEGYADLVAERVMGDRCPNGENAALLATQYARYHWSLGDLMASGESIDVHQYPLAHSIIAYLEGQDRGCAAPRRFAGLIRSLKQGKPFAAALASNYDGRTVEELEAGWRSSVAAGP